MNYTNAQFRDILSGLGYGSFSSGSTDFTPTNDNTPLTDQYTKECLKKFQQEYKLTPDGIAGSVTMAKARDVVTILQNELRTVVGANIPQNQPYYGPVTASAVKQAQSRFFPSQHPTGIANLAFRQRLYSEYSGQNPSGSGSQSGWRWCQKCQGLFFTGNSLPGVCPTGGGHDQRNSSSYRVLLQNLPGGGAQNHWNFCRKCQGLFFSGAGSSGVCPVGGQHDPTGSSDYSVLTQNPGDAAVQDNWNWCQKCQGLFFSGSGTLGVCPAGGQHSQTGSADYNLLIDASA